MHAASVHPEPGSNSHVKILCQKKLTSFSLLTVLGRFRIVILLHFWNLLFVLLRCSAAGSARCFRWNRKSRDRVRRIVRFVCISCCEAVRIFRVVSLFDYQGSSLSAVIAATFIEYHVFNLLSTLFSIFLWFIFFWTSAVFTAQKVYYHSATPVSTKTFQNFQIIF